MNTRDELREAELEARDWADLPEQDEFELSLREVAPEVSALVDELFDAHFEDMKRHYGVPNPMRDPAEEPIF